MGEEAQEGTSPAGHGRQSLAAFPPDHLLLPARWVEGSPSARPKAKAPRLKIKCDPHPGKVNR